MSNHFSFFGITTWSTHCTQENSEDKELTITMNKSCNKEKPLITYSYYIVVFVAYVEQ